MLTYGFIGIVNTGIHFVVFWSILYWVDLQAFANLCGFLIAVVFSFFMNARLTFKAKPTRRRFQRMVISMALVSVLFGAIGDVFKLYPLITFGIYFLLNPLIGFFVTKYFVFEVE